MLWAIAILTSCLFGFGLSLEQAGEITAKSIAGGALISSLPLAICTAAVAIYRAIKESEE
jgi:hypothetical protein